MDMFVLNGAALNGSAGVTVAQASANISARASFSADATRTVRSSAIASGKANFTALQTLTEASHAQGSGSALLLATSTHQHAAAASIHAGAGLVGYVLRTVQAEAGFFGSGRFVPVPASLAASADFSAGAALSATGTPVIAAKAAATAGVDFSISTAAYVNRSVEATVTAGGALRVEGGLNGVFDTYSDLRGGASLTTPNSGILFAKAAASIAPVSSVVPSATTAQAARAGVHAAATTNAAATVTAPAAAAVSGAAQFGPDATRKVLPSATAVAACILSAKAYQQHAAKAAASGGATATVIPLATRAARGSLMAGTDTLNASGTVLRMARANMSGSGSMTGSPRTIFGANTPNSKLVDSAVFTASAKVTRFGQAAATGAGGFTADPVVLKLSYALPSGAAGFSAEALVSRYVSAALSVSSSFTADGVRLVMVSAAAEGSSGMTALARTNVEALDPPERTVRRPVAMREVRRPFIDRTMRKAA